jgi:galactosylceramidase
MRSIITAIAIACVAAGAMAGNVAAMTAPSQTSSLEMNTTTAVLTFSPAHEHHGFGGLSAGASSRLLWDYPEQQREELLDYLFKPNFGAGLTINKVEIGGSVPSTDGAEPAIEPTGPGSLDCSRLSYEGWLMVESAKRNPNMKQYALSWGVPGWVGNDTYYSDENVQFHLDWMNCAKNTYSVNVDYIGVWNERSVGAVGMDWAVKLRRALDANGFQETQIIVPDGGHLQPDLLQLLQTNTTMRDAVFGIGLHYPCNQQSQAVQDLGLAYWASEDYSSDAATWPTGGDVWGRLIVQNYLE